VTSFHCRLGWLLHTLKLGVLQYFGNSACLSIIVEELIKILYTDLHFYMDFENIGWITLPVNFRCEYCFCNKNDTDSIAAVMQYVHQV
jgi:hypothetical protein